VSSNTDGAEKLLGAASQSTNRALKIIFVAEAKILIGRERERLRQQSELLDAMEAEIVRSANAEQLALLGSERR
jgi:hypothetical protein